MEEGGNNNDRSNKRWLTFLLVSLACFTCYLYLFHSFGTFIATAAVTTTATTTTTHTNNNNHTTISSNDTAIIPIKKKKKPKQKKDVAIVLRVVSPLSPMILSRIVQTARSFRFEEMERYDFVLLSDETGKNGTTQQLEEYYEKKRYTGKIPVPKVFNTSFDMMKQEFPAMINGYLYGLNVNNETGSFGPGLWQYQGPAVAMFFHHNPQYKYAWICEDDLTAIGPYSVPELFQQWDEELVKQNDGDGDLVAMKTEHGRVPFQRWVRLRHTWEFDDLLRTMNMDEKTSDKDRHANWTHWRNHHAPDWTRDLRYGNATVAPAWKNHPTTANETEFVAPAWTCVSDAIWRHSREYSQHTYRMFQQNIFQFGECLQQIMAISGNFKIVNLEKTLAGSDFGPSGMNKLTGVKTEYLKELKEKFLESEYSTHLIHEEIPFRKPGRK